jgi:hypothetical protein
MAPQISKKLEFGFKPSTANQVVSGNWSHTKRKALLCSSPVADRGRVALL